MGVSTRVATIGVDGELNLKHRTVWRVEGTPIGTTSDRE